MATIASDQPTHDISKPDSDLIDGRKWLSDFEKHGVDGLPPLAPTLEEFYTDIPTSDGWRSRCKVFRPKSTLFCANDEEKGSHPLIVYFFGGGFGMGSPEQVTRPAREWAEEHHATIVCPNYRLAPEHPWPQGVRDGWDVVSYLSRHAETDERFGNVKLSDGFVVGGVSAGAGLAGVIGGITLLTEPDMEYELIPPVEQLASSLTGLFLAVPLLVHEEMLPPAYKDLFTAWEDNRHDPAMSTANIMTTFRVLRCTDYKSPWFSPINVLERALPNSSDSSTRNVNIANHPRVYMQSCARDPLRDDPIIYQKLLTDVGLGDRARVDLFPDDGHTAWTALPLENRSKNPTMKEATLEGMRWLLEKHQNIS